MAALRKFYLTPEEYLDLERQAQTKSEYIAGEIYAMAGGSERHSLITINLAIVLGSQLKGRPCKIYDSNMRVKVNRTGLYTYPDLSVVCGKPRFDDKHQDTLLNPTLLIEVLSKSTESYDGGAKFGHYRTLESLTDYMLIAQDKPLIEHYARQPDDKWLLTAYNDLDAVTNVPTIACTLPLTEVYDKMEWPEEETPSSPFTLLKEPEADWGSEQRRPGYS